MQSTNATKPGTSPIPVVIEDHKPKILPNLEGLSKAELAEVVKTARAEKVRIEEEERKNKPKVERGNGTIQKIRAILNANPKIGKVKLFEEIAKAGIATSESTVMTLKSDHMSAWRSFRDAGLLNEVGIERLKAYFEN